MRRFVIKVALTIVVLGLFAVFLIGHGVWGTVVGAVNAGLGQDAAQKTDQFGKTSKDIADGAQKTLTDTEQALSNGGAGHLDFDGIDHLLVGLPTTTPGQRIPEYRRAEFGQPWADVDHNGCDTRNDILKRDLTGTTIDSRCRVLSGTLHDPYTGKDIAFVRGEKTSPAVQIDHIYSLGQSWVSGSFAWTPAERESFANDPLNLIAVDGPTNVAKSDKGPADWMPENLSFRCVYAARYVVVASKYKLDVNQRDKGALQSELATCKG